MRQESGFTLVELLTAVSIVGVLSAIAVPQYAEYSQQAFDSQAVKALRAIAVAQEAYFIQSDQYVTCSESDCHLKLPNLPPADAGVRVQVTSFVNDFEANASHDKGTGHIYRWGQ